MKQIAKIEHGVKLNFITVKPCPSKFVIVMFDLHLLRRKKKNLFFNNNIFIF